MSSETFGKLEKNNTTDCLYPYILKMLSEKPTHAYVIRNEIGRRFGFRPGNVTAYRVLYSLKNLGLVEKTKNNRTKVYRITKKGILELKRVLKFYRERLEMLS